MPLNKDFLRVIIIILGIHLPLLAADWPQWRGPNRDGIWREKGIVERFVTEQLPVRWRAEISNGYSGPTAADGRVYVTDRVTAPIQAERVHCFDAMTGAKIWSHDYECKYEQIDHRNGPRAAVTVDDGRAYSLGAMGHLFCFDATDGGILWDRDLRRQYKIRMPEWGIAASPLIEDKLVIVLISGQNACLVALNKITGEQVWRALGDRAGYAAPIVIEQAGKRVVVCWTGERVVGLDLLTGELYWQYPFPPARMIHNIATPVFENNYIFVSGFFDGSLLLKVPPDEMAVQKIWQRRGSSEKDTDSLHCCISTPILQGDHVYGLDAYGELRCLDLHTGERIWESRLAVPQARWATAHMVRHEGQVWMLNERGELIISRLSPERYEEVSRTKLIEPTQGQLDQRGGVCWAHPAFAYRHIYARNDEELICADLSAKQ
ncbi:MAG TPA: PQQ-binding-like beta-propeller repeat protein [Sedimentisphaerales bacterium]|nr:PQQ-binding-like beta-propeller repeat protein [Sedimentisphaerales bacterium]